MIDGSSADRLHAARRSGGFDSLPASWVASYRRAKEMTASHQQKVEQIISTGDIPSVESNYEQDRVVGLLEDYAEHPDSSELVRERAENAIEQFT